MFKNKKSTIRTVLINALCIIAAASLLLLSGCQDGGDNQEDSPSQSDGNDTTDENGVTEDEPIELEDWDGVHIKSTTNNDGDAVITGQGVKVVYDEETNSNVLRIDGDGYLELPMYTFKDITDQFTVTLDVKISESCADGANIIQFNPCGYAIGDTYWRDAPEISIKSDLLTTFYIGGRTINGVFSSSATYNNGYGSDDLAYSEPNGYKTRYTGEAAAAPDKSKWSKIVLSVSNEQYTLYLDGEAVEMTDTTDGSDIASSLAYLFNEDIIQTYVVNSIGNSVYSDVANFSGEIDNLSIYASALTGEQVRNIEQQTPFLSWDFSNNSVVSGGTSAYVSDLTKYIDGTALYNSDDVVCVSPDEKLRVLLKKDANNRYYLASIHGDTVITEASLLGFELEGADLTTGLTLDTAEITTNSIDETFSIYTGMSAEATNKCNETVIPFTKDNASFKLIIRVYDDGFAYKYEDVTVEGSTDLTVTDEASEYILSDRAVTWGFQLNGTYEGEFVKRTNSQLMTQTVLLSTPLLVEIDGYYVLFSEGGVYNNDGEYCSSGLQTNIGSKQLLWDFGLARDPAHESTGDLDSPGHIAIKQVETVNGFSTPWRAAIISNDVDTFYNSNLIAALNDAPDEELYADTSYIKPGKVAWSWWSEGDAVQRNYDKHIEYIDFAAKNGWEYICIDAGWRSLEERMSELCDYAKSKNVGIFVWINYRDMKELSEMDRLFSEWSAAGVVGLKTDYFESDEPSVLYNMQMVAETAAKYRMMVLYHGCVRPAGEYRTYPNVLTMEAVQGEEWHKWFDYPTTVNCLVYPFTRNLLGSMDYTPIGSSVARNGETNGFGIAKAVVYQSALQHFANAAAAYSRFNGLSLLNHIPTTWDSTKVYEGATGEYISMMRNKENEYYLGAMTIDARTVSYTLDFLGEGTYYAYIYEDNDDASALNIRSEEVTSADTLSFDLMENGGVAVMLTKEVIDIDSYGDSETDNENYTYYEAESSSNTLRGTAVVSTAVLCSGGKKVGYVGNGANNTLTFENVTVDTEGDYEVILYYCCGEERKTDLTVNGSDEVVELTGLYSGSYDNYASVTFTVHLQAGTNSLTFGNGTYYAPDFDRIAVSRQAE